MRTAQGVTVTPVLSLDVTRRIADVELSGAASTGWRSAPPQPPLGTPPKSASSCSAALA
jgi:hypothetical protein